MGDTCPSCPCNSGYLQACRHELKAIFWFWISDDSGFCAFLPSMSGMKICALVFASLELKHVRTLILNPPKPEAVSAAGVIDSQAALRVA